MIGTNRGVEIFLGHVPNTIKHTSVKPSIRFRHFSCMFLYGSPFSAAMIISKFVSLLAFDIGYIQWDDWCHLIDIIRLFIDQIESGSLIWSHVLIFCIWGSSRKIVCRACYWLNKKLMEINTKVAHFGDKVFLTILNDRDLPISASVIEIIMIYNHFPAAMPLTRVVTQ